VSAAPPEPDGIPRAASGRHASVESEHVDVGTAHITVTSAEIVQSPQSRQQARYLAYSMCMLFLFMVCIGAANLLFTSRQVHNVQTNSNGLTQANARLNKQLTAISVTNARLEQQVKAECGFDQDLAGLPVVNSMNGHPSQLLIKIISDARSAWFGHGCTGSLPAPSGAFIAGARYYGLPVVLTGD
jgi:hypothetical protein